MVIKILSDKNTEFEKIIQGTSYGGIISNLVQDINNEKTQLSKFLKEFTSEDFTYFEIKDYNGQYFTNNITGGPSFSIKILGTNKEIITSFKIVVTPNCCGLCHICDVTLNKNTKTTSEMIFLYEKIMLLALGLSSYLKYSKAFYTDAVANRISPSNRLRYYFGYINQTKEISHPYWKKISESVSQKTAAFLLLMECDLSMSFEKYHKVLITRLNNITNDYKKI